jgi:hypothetical protein
MNRFALWWMASDVARISSPVVIGAQGAAGRFTIHLRGNSASSAFAIRILLIGYISRFQL